MTANDTQEKKANSAAVEVVEMEPIMVDAKTAAKLCGVGRSSWLDHASAGKTPASVRLGGRVLWLRDELVEWCKAGCPNREKWERLRKSP